VLVTDVNQNFWVTNQMLWRAPRREEGQGLLSWFLPARMRKWVGQGGWVPAERWLLCLLG